MELQRAWKSKNGEFLGGAQFTPGCLTKAKGMGLVPDKREKRRVPGLEEGGEADLKAQSFPPQVLGWPKAEVKGAGPPQGQAGTLPKRLSPH